jgi:polyisoprenoid-binding protein YceI
MTGEYHDKLVGHLKSDDFFAVAKFGTATIKIKTATPIKGTGTDANNYTIVADLTIKGITNEVTFPALVVVNAKEVIVNADLNVNRAKFDVRYGSNSFFDGLGDKAISDDFNVKVRVVANK